MIQPDSSTTRRRFAADLWLPLALGAAVLVARIPGMGCDFEMNLDEGQMIAQAMRYRNDLLPWRSVNGTTSGPLNTWYLNIANALGMPLEYAWTHAAAALALASAVVLAFLAARRLFGRTGALIGGLFGSLWVALHQYHDFVHYSSELVPILLVAASLFLVGRSYRLDLVAAFTLGLMPWAKLQVVPVGAVMGLWLVARTIWPPKTGGSISRPTFPLRVRVLRASWITFVACIPSLLMVSAVVRGGAWEECRQAYFLANLSYAGDTSLAPFLGRFLDCTVRSSTVSGWCVGLALAAVAVPWRRLLPARLADWRGPGALAVGVLAASAYAWARPIWELDHYDLLLLPGLIFATAAVAEPACGDARGSRRARLAALAIAVVSILVLAKSALEDEQSQLDLRGSANRMGDLLLGGVRAFSPGFRTLAVWGWCPSIYVKGGITPPIRQVHCGFIFFDTPSRNFFRASFARDLEKSLPDIVIDTGGMRLEKLYGGIHLLETPELAPVIRAHYRLKGSIDTDQGTAYVYALKPR